MEFKIFIFCLMILVTIDIAYAGNRTLPVRQSRPRAVTVYKTPTCDCCKNYIVYLRAKKYKVTELNLDEKLYVARKRTLGVPASLDSCHTTVIEDGNYFVEGHVPYEAINKLLADKPKIRGISLPGMPSASPGMPGGKTAPFSVKQVSRNGAVFPYLTL